MSDSLVKWAESKCDGFTRVQRAEIVDGSVSIEIDHASSDLTPSVQAAFESAGLTVDQDSWGCSTCGYGSTWTITGPVPIDLAAGDGGGL